MTDDRKSLGKDAAWLQQKVVGLLEDASLRDPPDHQACARYAEILFKMLPKGEARSPAQAALDEARQAVLEGGAPKK